MHRLRSTSFAALTLVSAVAVLPARAAPTLLLLHTFNGAPDGSAAEAAPTPGPNGVLYGTTPEGGTSGLGIAYELTPAAGGQTPWTETILFNFGAGYGSYPNAGLIVAKNGTLYGSAASGGQYNGGTVFRLTPPSGKGTAWAYSRLHSFNKAVDGDKPGNLVAINDDSLFGPTGTDGHIFPYGTVFELTPPAVKNGPAIETTLATQGGPMVPNGAGGFYVQGYEGLTLYNLTPPATPGGSWSEQTIFNTTLGNANCPIEAIASDTKGHIYATVYCAGSRPNSLYYAIVQFVPPASGSGLWTENAIYQPNTELLPFIVGDLTVDSHGVLYSCQENNAGQGVVFTLTPPVSASSSWTEATYFVFPQTGYPVASVPQFGMSIDSIGNLYFTGDGAGINDGVWEIEK